MLAPRNGFARRNILLFIAGLGVPAALSACGDAQSTSEEATTVPQEPSGPTTVLAQYEGGYDGENFWYRPMAISNEGVGGSDGVGVVNEAVESQQTNAFYTATGGAGGTAGAGGAAPQTNTILIEQKEFHDQTTWPTATCGPTPAKGSCVRWRLFNAFAAQDLFRGYFYLTTLTPPTTCTTGCAVTVKIPAPGASVQTSVSDPGLLGITPASGSGGASASGGAPGLWRYGLLEHSGPEVRAPERWLAFVGTGTDPTTGKWGFHWVGQVRGTRVTPTVRASLRDGTMDKAPFYTADGIADGGMLAGSDIHATPDGRYVVFASSGTAISSHATGSGTKVFRYDTMTGAIVVANLLSGGTNAPNACAASNPSISADGSQIVFQSSGCDLGFGTTSRQIYLRNVTAGTTALVSHGTASLTTPADSDSQTPRIAGGGGFVTFLSEAGNVFAGRPAARLGRVYDVYRYTVGSGLIERANIPTTGPATWPNISQARPDISSNGSRVIFDSSAQVLVPGDRAVNLDVFLYDFGGAGMSLLSVGRTGAQQQSSSCYLGAISGNGASVAFVCATAGSDSFVATPAATAGRYHTYTRTVASAASLTMVDTAPSTGLEGNAGIGAVPPALNDDGQLVGYISSASNLLRTAACNTPTGACMPSPTSFFNAFVRDMGSPDPEVQRSFLVSQIRSKLATAVQPFVAAERGLSTTNASRTLTLTGLRDGATAIYLASGGNSTDWAQAPSSGGYQIYISPFSDALFQ
jgi:hypothetical protein